MKRLLTVIFITLLSLTMYAQVRVYNGRSTYTSDVVCNVKDGKVYKKNSTYTSDIICNVRGKRIYRGTSGYTSDVICNIQEGKVYKGTSSYSSDILFTIRDGKIYKGRSEYTSDIIATIRNGKVYSGTSSYSSDIMFHYDGMLSIEEFVAVLMVEWAKIRDTGRKSPNVRNKMLKGLLEMENNKGIKGLSSLLDKYKVKF